MIFQFFNMKKKLKKAKVKKLTQEQQEARAKNKAAAMEARTALGFDKMKITGVKPRVVYDKPTITWQTVYTPTQVQQILTQTHLNPK